MKKPAAAPPAVQEVTFVPRKKRRGGHKLQAKVIPSSPATPASGKSHSNVGTPSHESHIPQLQFNDGCEEHICMPKASKRGRVSLHHHKTRNSLTTVTVAKRLHEGVDAPKGFFSCHYVGLRGLSTGSDMFTLQKHKWLPAVQGLLR